MCKVCDAFVLAETRTPFVMCPYCAKKVSVEESSEKFDEFISLPANTSVTIAKCLELESAEGVVLPILILGELIDKFPKNEELAFLFVRMMDYDRIAVKNYLTNFKGVRKKQPFAKEFLSEALTVRNMEYVNMFEEYVENKIEGRKKRKYLEIMQELKTAYVGSAYGDASLGLLYTFFVIAILINLGLTVFFILSNFHLVVYTLLALAVLAIEITLLFLHNRIYGNRLEISETERLLMVAFMSTIVIVVGGVFVGALANNWF